MGSFRPVNSSSFDASSAASMSGLSASCASAPCFDASASYCSTYMRIVAPALPVPERRKMIRLESANTKRRPCFDATLPSTGSVYSKSSQKSSSNSPNLSPFFADAITPRRCSIIAFAFSLSTAS